MTDWKQELFTFWDNVKTGNDLEWKYGVDCTGWRKESHIPYTGDYHPMHVLNLYYPADLPQPGQKLPTIIDIHGGGWLYGTVDDSERYLGYLASKGYAVMGMNYRLLQETDLGGIIEDIYAAMHWLEKRGPARGFDLGRVLLTGDSAGGHLTNLVACIQKSEELQRAYGVQPFSFPLSVLCVCCPCAETDRLFILEGEDTERGRGTAQAYRELMLGAAGESAPWNGHMSASETMPGLKLPPLLLIGSETESLYAQTCMLLDTLSRTGQQYETLIWKKEDGAHLQHVFNVSHWEWRESLISNDRMLAFFDAQTKR